MDPLKTDDFAAKMESYPREYLFHLVPLVVVQGLGSSIDGYGSGSPQRALESLQSNNVEMEELFRNQKQVSDSIGSTKNLSRIWYNYHVDDIIWDSSALKSESNNFPHRYHFEFVDTHALPKVKDHSESIPSSSSSNQIFSIGWVQKYKSIIPSLFISFYELDGKSTEPQEIEKMDHELISEINTLKAQLNSRNVKHLVIFTSPVSSSTEFGVAERLNLIRRQTGMNNRNCLLLLHSATPKEVSTLAQGTLQVIKAAGTEFYVNAEKRIRKKRARALGNSNDDFSKCVIEARYALKLGFINEFKQQYEYAVKSFEISYENLIEIFETLDIKDPNWSPYRLLLDVSIFHIVKLNLYQELTNLSYRKFDVHIQSVIYFLKHKSIAPKSYSVCNWLSQQFKWLAQLSDLAPHSLVPIDVPYKADLKDRLSPLVLPHSGYLYLQSIHLLKRRELIKENEPNTQVDPYFAHVETEDFDASLKNLLNFAKLAFQKKDNVFGRSISFINFQLAEEFLKIKDFEDAIKFYEQSLEILKEDDWGYLSSTIFHKLLKCSMALNKHCASVVNLLEFCLIPQSQLNPSSFTKVQQLVKPNGHLEKFLKDQSEKLLINVSTDKTYDILKAEVLFKKTEFSLSSTAQFQLKLKSNLNDTLSDVSFNDVLVTFQGSLLPILLKSDSTLQRKTVSHVGNLKIDEVNNYLVGSTNLVFRSYEEKILTFEIPTKKIGTNSCVSVSSTLNYKDLFDIKLDVPLITTKFKTRHYFYDATNETKTVVLNHNPAFCEIVPRIPETKISFGEIGDFAVLGENFELPLLINNSDHEAVDLQLEACVVLGDRKIETSWDEDHTKLLELKSLKIDEELEHLLKFEVPTTVENGASGISVNIKVTYFVGNDYEVPIVENLNTKIVVVDPFEISISFSPRLLDKEFPSVFVVKDGDQPQPKPSRFWLTKVIIVNSLKTEIELLSEKISFVSCNKEILCKELLGKVSSQTKGNKMMSDHIIETAIENGRTYRNITFDSMLIIKYKRKRSGKIQEYHNKPWKFNLPLLDPRVLLDLETSEASKDLKLIFMIENPTSKLFSFAVNLIENQNFQVSGSKVQNVSILPCTRHKIEYHAVPLGSGWLNIPQLTVYDLNFRVNLPTLVVTDKAQVHNREIFVHIQE